ncbi:hypothetical protein [Streptomyces sp. DH12]|uniref:hypothetical protein n=1 Tax=Streptomyces sp. DH12 TaxID=2857010 RepID=UPI001E53924C|nr:hypothetical protein [Streptomyces sp. DH12]
MSSRKVPPPIPVVGGAGGGVDSVREEQLRAWEEEQQQRQREAAAGQAAAPAAASPAPVAVIPQPAPADTASQPAVESAVASRATATGYLPMPEFVEPTSVDPGERLEFYSRGILAVQYAARANHERAEQQRLIGLGLRLRAIKEEELHKTSGHDTFGDLVLERFGFKKHQANNIIRSLGVAQAVEDLTTQELKERPLRVLVPVLDKHGRDAVRAVWVEASRQGSVTEKSLEEAANFLGFAAPKDVTPAAPGPDNRPAAAAQPSEASRIVERLRKLAEKDPHLATREAEALKAGIEEFMQSLGVAAE